MSESGVTVRVMGKGAEGTELHSPESAELNLGSEVIGRVSEVSLSSRRDAGQPSLDSSTTTRTPSQRPVSRSLGMWNMTSSIEIDLQ